MYANNGQHVNNVISGETAAKKYMGKLAAHSLTMDQNTHYRVAD